ncbi:MAG: response regulator, partial [Cyanobacteria bacterium J06553_1]
EICAQIRRVSSLQKVPVIIVTSNNGIIDRIRTRLKGANGFMSKPIDATKVLKIINKYVVPMQTLQAS